MYLADVIRDYNFINAHGLKHNLAICIWNLFIIYLSIYLLLCSVVLLNITWELLDKKKIFGGSLRGSHLKSKNLTSLLNPHGHFSDSLIWPL